MLPDDEALVEKIYTHATAVNHTILSDQEIHRSRELLSIEKHVLSDIDLEIKALFAKRDRQEQHIAKFHLALAPHKHVPPELLSRIFNYCLPADTVNSKITFPPNPSQAPWLLGQVCSLWRQISRNETHLWGEASIDMDEQAHRQSLTRLCDILPIQIALSLNIRGRLGGRSAHGSKAVTKILIPHLWRLHKLDLELQMQRYDELLRIVPPSSFANLQSATFRVIRMDSFNSGLCCSAWAELTPFRLAGKLRSLTLEGPEPFALAFLHLAVPWDQLTDLTVIAVRGVYLSNVFKILQSGSSLESLSINCIRGDNFSRRRWVSLSERVPEGSIHMHAFRTVYDSVTLAFIDRTDLWKQLSTLDLEGIKLDDGRVLHSIIKHCAGLTGLIAPVPHKGTAHTTDGDLPLPRLTTLKLLGIHDTWIFKSLVTPALTTLYTTFETRPHLAPIRNMLDSSGCSLLELTLKYVGERAENNAAQPIGLNGLLAAIPQAVAVTLYILVKDTIFADIGRDILLPQLQFLACCPTSLEAFCDMLETRLERGLRENRATLRNVRIELPQEANASPAIKALAKAFFRALKRTYGIEYELRRHGAAAMEGRD